MDAILGTKPATHPPVVVDTLQDSSDIQEDMNENENEIPENPGTSASANKESMPKSRTTMPYPHHPTSTKDKTLMNSNR